MKYSILYKNKNDVLNPSIVSGIGKRANVLMNYLEDNSLLSGVYDYSEIDQIDTDSLVISFMIDDEEVFEKLESKGLKVCNSYCSGHDKPTKWLYTSENIKLRFLSKAVKDLCEGFYDESNSFICHHGFSNSEYKVLDNPKKYFLWCASLGWGLDAKGLNSFITMAQYNPDFEFIAYGGRWNSSDIEKKLISAQSRIKNFKIKFDLSDEEKDEVFSKAIAFCQFSLLKEAGNVLTIESLLRETPVLTLDVDNGSVKEYLGDMEIKLTNYRLTSDILDQVELVRSKLKSYNRYKNKFSCKSEIRIIQKNFNE